MNAALGGFCRPSGPDATDRPTDIFIDYALDMESTELYRINRRGGLLLEPKLEGVRAGVLAADITRLAQSIEALGAVNLAALEELGVARERKGFLDSQCADLNEAVTTLEEAIRKLPEVISCHYISGAGTFELQVVASDLDAFSQFSRTVLLNLPNVKDLHTSFSLGEVKASRALPLAHLEQTRPDRSVAQPRLARS